MSEIDFPTAAEWKAGKHNQTLQKVLADIKQALEDNRDPLPLHIYGVWPASHFRCQVSEVLEERGWRVFWREGADECEPNILILDVE